MLTTKFEAVNSKFNLSEKINEPKIVRKVLRTLLERSPSKVISIKESKDLQSLKIDELLGSLQTYELTHAHSKKYKNIVLKTVKEEDSYSSNDDDVEENLVLLGKNLNNFLKLKKNQRWSKELKGK